MRLASLGMTLFLLTCATAPAAAQICGDGIPVPPETCDDGNLVDGDGCSSLCLLENLPPVCLDADPSVAELWPPNHELVPVTIDGVIDPDGDPVAITVTAVAQDEPVDDVGDGATCPDALGVGTPVAQLRSERQGPGDGRVYHVTFAAADPLGATCVGTVTVCVPHDRGRGAVCGDGGPLFDATAGDALACGPPVCDPDDCIPPGDMGCGDLPRLVARRAARASTLLVRAMETTKPARRARLGRRALRLLDRAERAAARLDDPACVVGSLDAAAECAACVVDEP